MEEFLKGIDWELLRRQKVELLDVINMYKLPAGNHLDGVVYLIDHIQDSAVDSGYYTEEQVFGKREKE